MNHQLAYSMKMLKGNRNTTTLLFYLKGLGILHQVRIGQVKIMVMEHLNGILFHKSGPANKQHAYQWILTMCTKFHIHLLVIVKTALKFNSNNMVVLCYQVVTQLS